MLVCSHGFCYYCFPLSLVVIKLAINSTNHIYHAQLFAIMALFAKKSVNRKPFLGRTIFFTYQNYLTKFNVTKLQKWHQEDLEVSNLLSGYKIFCSLTAILHRVILVSECHQLLFFKWYFWLQENFLVSQVRTSHKFSNFFAFFWQTPFFVVVRTGPNNIKLLSVRWFC